MSQPKDTALHAEPDATREYFRIRRGQQERKKSVTDEMGATRTDFVESTNLNKTAVGFCERLDRLSPEVRGDVLRSLDMIREQMGPVWSQHETPDMFDAPTTPEQKFEAGAQEAKRARTTARRNKAPKLAAEGTPGGAPYRFGHPDDGPFDEQGNSLKDAQPEPINWRDPIPGVDDDEPAETGGDAPFDVDAQDADFLAPDEPEAA